MDNQVRIKLLMDNQVRIKLLSELRKLRDEGPRHSDWGICNNVPAWARRAMAPHLDALWEKWPHYTGIRGFPVPHPRSKHPGAAAKIYLHPRTLHWSRRTKYGRLRWALLDWLIEQLEKGDG